MAYAAEAGAKSLARTVPRSTTSGLLITSGEPEKTTPIVPSVDTELSDWAKFSKDNAKLGGLQNRIMSLTKQSGSPLSVAQEVIDFLADPTKTPSSTKAYDIVEKLERKEDSTSLTTKDKSVNLKGLNAKLEQGLMSTVMPIYSKLSNTAMTITSGNDGRHAPGSAHYKGNAVDLRVNGMTEDQKTAVYNAMVAGLGKDWKIIFRSPGHYDHIHLEYVGGN
jgi:hypothetical protein